MLKKTDDMFYDIYMKMLGIQDLYEKSAYLKKNVPVVIKDYDSC